MMSGFSAMVAGLSAAQLVQGAVVTLAAMIGIYAELRVIEWEHRNLAGECGFEMASPITGIGALFLGGVAALACGVASELIVQLP